MFKALTDLWAAAHKLSAEDRKRSIRFAGWVSAGLLVLGLLLAMAFAARVVPADHPLWETALQARLVLTRLVLAVPLLVIGATLGVTLYQLIENSELGHRLLIWAELDGPQVMAQKTSNSGALLAACIAACILGLLLGVLR